MLDLHKNFYNYVESTFILNYLVIFNIMLKKILLIKNSVNLF